MASHTRLIDRVPPALTVMDEGKPIQVLVLGMSRTGTMSMKTALETLGYHPYHMSECIKHWRDQHLHYWDEALKAKYRGPGKPYQVAEFNKIFKGYDAITDIPSILFVDELLDAYPQAKVILTNRDVDKWLVSMDRTFYAVLRWRTMGLLARMDPRLIGPYWSLLHIIMSQWTNGDWRNQQALRKGFLEHYKHVRAVVPKERLLEFKSEDGWEPLCQFLDVQVPENTPYPHVNDGDGVIKLHKFLYWIRLVKALARYLGPVAVVALGVWVLRYAR